MSAHDDFRDYQHGLRGGSPLTANNALAWAAGDIARKNKEALATPLQGEEHPNAWQIFILAGVVAALIGSLLELRLVPAVITVSWWRVGGVWLLTTTVAYFGLKVLPGWLAGSVMGLGLGGTAAYLGWVHLSPIWAAGIGLGIAALMYFLFSRLK